MTAVTSMVIWAVYLLGLGTWLVLAPNSMLTLFGFEPTGEVWIRVVGVLLLLLGYYCASAAKTRNAEFMRWSISARACVPLFFIAFVGLGLAKPMLLLFGVVDLAGAALTWAGFRNDLANGVAAR